MKAVDPKMKRFFSRLSYSFGNEDWETEREALQISPGDKVLCITASGDRSLHLLLDDCAQLTSVDANPIQNHLLGLKSAALQALNYDEYIGFLGGVPLPRREAFLPRVTPYLSKETAAFWAHNKKLIGKGVLYQGVLERATKLISAAFGILRPFKMRKIFKMRDLEEQKKYLKKWDTYFFRKIFDVLLSNRVCRLFALDPGLYAHTDTSMSLGAYIYSRMIHSLNHSLAKDNLLFSLIFRGYVEPSAFPPYLNLQGYGVIRERLNRLSMTTGDINHHLESMPENSYDRFSLSDVASYLNQENFRRLIKNVYRTAKPGARFCIRQFSSNQPWPVEFEAHFKRELSLEKRLEQKDRCFVYRFMVGQVVK